MGTDDASGPLGAFRRAAREFLEIPPSATEEEVRRVCLLRIEDEGFSLDDDTRGAVELLCGDPILAFETLKSAPQISLAAERIVRGELEAVAARLRTESGEAVQPALEALAKRASPFPAARAWHEHLLRVTQTGIPHNRMTPEQQRLVLALVETATTWPADAADVRRKHLAEMSRSRGFVDAATTLRKSFPWVADLDPLLMTALVVPVLPSGGRRPTAGAGAAKDDASGGRGSHFWIGWLVVSGVISLLRIASSTRSSDPSRPFPTRYQAPSLPVSPPSAPKPIGIRPNSSPARPAPWQPAPRNEPRPSMPTPSPFPGGRR